MSLDLHPFSDDQTAAAVAFQNEVAVALHGAPSTSEEEYRTWLTTPGVEPARDIVLASREGELVGTADVYDQNSWHTRYWCEVNVAPDGDSAVAEELVAWCERRARADAADGAFLRMYVPEPAELLRAVVAARGFAPIRSSFRMEIDLADATDPPEWPDGVTVRTFAAGDERTLYEANEECFADHWEHVEEPFEEFLHWTVERETWDPSLVFLAEEGGDVAAYAVCAPHDGQPELAFVHLLGVRRPWRKRGLGLALLRHAFGEFRTRGFPRAGLGVDAENLTGAVRLYERAGMHVARRSDCFELRL